MLVFKVAIYIMNIQIVQIYMLHRASVFGDAGYAGTIHPVVNL